MAGLKEAVIRGFDDLIEIASRNDTTTHNQLIEFKERFVNRSYRILVVGTFTSGKSTLVNAFLGEDLLPTGLVPTTKAVVELRHGDRVAAVEVMSDGREVPIRIDDLKSKSTVLSEDGSFYRFYCDHAFISNGLMIVDTPGIEDRDEKAYEITLREIPKADAIIMLFNAGEGGYGDAERRFLENVVLPDDAYHKFFAVCNKIDLQTEDGAAKRFVEWLQQQLPRTLGTTGRVMPVSALWALEGRSKAKPDLIEKSGIRNIEESIMNFLKTDRETDEIRRTVKFTASMAELLRGALLKKKEALELSDKDLQSERAELKRQMEDLHRAEENRLDKNRAIFDSICKSFAGDLEDFIDNLKSRVRDRIRNLPPEDLKKIENLEANLSIELNKFVSAKLQELETNLRAGLNNSRIEMQSALGKSSVKLDMDFIEEPLLLRHPEVATIGSLIVAWPLMGIFSWAATAVAVALGREEIERLVRKFVGDFTGQKLTKKLQEAVDTKLDRIYRDSTAKISEIFEKMEHLETKTVKEQLQLAATPIRIQLEEMDGERKNPKQTRQEIVLIEQHLATVKQIREDCFAWSNEVSHA